MLKLSADASVIRFRKCTPLLHGTRQTGLSTSETTCKEGQLLPALEISARDHRHRSSSPLFPIELHRELRPSYWWDSYDPRWLLKWLSNYWTRHLWQTIIVQILCVSGKSVVSQKGCRTSIILHIPHPGFPLPSPWSVMQHGSSESGTLPDSQTYTTVQEHQMHYTYTVRWARPLGWHPRLVWFSRPGLCSLTHLMRTKYWRFFAWFLQVCRTSQSQDGVTAVQMISLPGCKYNNVGFELRPVVKHNAPFGKVWYFAIVLQFNLSFADQLARSSICKTGLENS